jgi:hypothetical protein
MGDVKAKADVSGGDVVAEADPQWCLWCLLVLLVRGSMRSMEQPP